jgi:hypothetical protein
MVRRRRCYWRTQASRLIVGCMTCAHLACASGVPLPVPNMVASGPVGCMSPCCGCHSAGALGGSCCCCGHSESPKWETPLSKSRPNPEFRTLAVSPCCRGHAGSGSNQPRSHAGGWVLRMSPMRCHGNASAWIAKTSVNPPPMFELWQPFNPQVGTIALLNVLPERISTIPPVPPPRPSAA